MTAPLRVLIVDDEPIARRRLARLLRPIADVAVVGEAGDVAAAVASTRRLAPDLLLLDIQMPGGDGFDVIDRLGREAPPVVFVTAFDHHAIRAFDLEAVDYVTKPVEAPRLAQAIARARAAAAARGHDERVAELLATVETLRRSLRAGEPTQQALWVRDGPRHRRLPLGDIGHIEAEGDYVRIHEGGRSHLVSDSLAAMEARLAPLGFVRIHRGTLVRREAIVAVERAGYGALAVSLDDGARLRVGRSYAPALRTLLREG
ncbi:MAG: LytTR family DNA-binding domain-containing protein [Amaricoccus sp.]